MDFLYHWVQAHSVFISAMMLVVTYFFIATEFLPKVTIVLCGATLTIMLGLLSQEKFLHDALYHKYFINFVDFDVIFLLVAMMIIVNISSKSGVFNWMANKLLMITKGNPQKVLWALGLFTAVASAFLDNVTTVILIMPITFVVAKHLDIDPVPFLITEILASNIGGTATLIGDPPNIIIGSAAGFGFKDFLFELTDIVVLILFVSLAILSFLFRKKLVTSEENMEKIKHIDNSSTITNYPLMIRSVIVLSLVVLGFMLHDVIHIKACVIAMAGASVLLLFEKPQQILHEIEWNTIFFFIGLFIIIGGLEASGGIAIMAKWLLDITNGSQVSSAMVILWGSGILSGIVDNIPCTVTMAPMLLQIQNAMGAEYVHPLWWCLSLGACLGGNMTIIGAAANVIVAETADVEGCPIHFMHFLKYGVLITFVSLILSSIYIYFRFLV